MGFTGVIVLQPAAAREALLELAADLGDDEGEELLAGGWVYSVLYGSDIADLDTEAAAKEVVERSGDPVLWASIFDSEFATLAAAGPGLDAWLGCLDREGLIQNTEELIDVSGHDGDVERYLLPVQRNLPALLKWCASAGLLLDEPTAAGVLGTTGSYAQDLVIQLIQCLSPIPQA